MSKTTKKQKKINVLAQSQFLLLFLLPSLLLEDEIRNTNLEPLDIPESCLTNVKFLEYKYTSDESYFSPPLRAQIEYTQVESCLEISDKSPRVQIYPSPVLNMS